MTSTESMQEVTASASKHECTRCGAQHDPGDGCVPFALRVKRIERERAGLAAQLEAAKGRIRKLELTDTVKAVEDAQVHQRIAEVERTSATLALEQAEIKICYLEKRLDEAKNENAVLELELDRLGAEAKACTEAVQTLLSDAHTRLNDLIGRVVG